MKCCPASIGALLCATLCGVSPALAAPAQIRGAWVTTTGYTTGDVRTSAILQSSFAALHDIGLNSIYMDAWRDGATWFPSATLKSITGSDRHASLGSTRDLLQEATIQAHRNGMANVAWFQYGFATAFTGNSNALTTYMKNKGWVLKDNAGNYTGQSNNFAWMNPAVPEVRQFLIGIVTDAVKKYDLDGVQFDDRLAWPVNYGFDDYTKNLYKSETGRDLPAGGSEASFLAWRAGKVTAFAKELSVAVKSVNPNCIVSVAPSPYPFGYQSYAADWPAWSRTNVTVNGQSVPMVDEIIPQVYSSTVSYFQNEWGRQQGLIDPSRRGDLGVGISINNSAGAPYDWATVNQPQVQAADAASGTAGHVWWYSDGVLHTDAQQIAAYYDVAANGRAERPDRPAGYFQASLVASNAGAGRYQANVAAPGQYSVITNVNGVWSIVETRVFPAGASTFPIAGSPSAVELILDHRPASLFSEVAWNVDASGNTSSGANWSHGAVQSGPDLAVRFGYVASATRTVTLDVPLTAGSVKFDNASGYTLTGPQAITLKTTSGFPSLAVTTGRHTIESPLNLAAATDLTLSANTGLALAGPVSGKLRSLSLGTGATLDVGANGLVVAYSASNPTAAITNWIKAAYNGGRWDKAGITSSLAGSTPGMAVGVADNAVLQLTTFMVQDVPTASTFLRYTYLGDTNLDGVVDAADRGNVEAALLLPPGIRTWVQGDFNYDGKLTSDDLALFALGAAVQSGPPGPPVPEPSAVLLVAAVLARRTRRG